MSILKSVLACVEQGTINKLVRYQVVLAVTAVIEAVNIILVASLVSFLLTGEMSFALTRAAGIMASFGLITDPTVVTVGLISYIAGANVLMSLLGILNIFVLSHIAADAGRRLSDKVLGVFLSASSNDVLKDGPNSVSKLLTLEAARVTDHIFQNVAQINARIYTGFVVCLVLLVSSASAFMISATLFIITYLILMLIVRRRLGTFGSTISRINENRIKLIEEMTTGYKEIKSLSAGSLFYENISREHEGYARMYRNLNLIYNTPRFVIELIVFLCLTFLTAYSISSNTQGSGMAISQFLPIFGLAALKLLPIFQQLYSGYAQARAHVSAAVVISSYFDKFKEGAVSSAAKSTLPNNAISNVVDEVEFKSLSFKYGSDDPRFTFDFSLKKGAINFIIGPSGAGKTTLLEIISDLRSADAGTVNMGDDKFDLTRTSLQTACSYNTQRSFVLAGTVLENLTLGRFVSPEEINRVIRQAQLQDLIDTLPKGLDTQIGVGVRELSVGQTQRLGLARHLIAQKSVLILDEPTSNLDQTTADSVFFFLREISQTVFVVCVTHDTERIGVDDHVIHIAARETGS